MATQQVKKVVLFGLEFLSIEKIDKETNLVNTVLIPNQQNKLKLINP